MGVLTGDLAIWTPDGADLNEPDVYLKTMAQSIQDGAGARLTLQEKAIGLKASVSTGVYTIPYGAPTTIPYAVFAGRGDFNQGFTFAAGVATVTVAGMYLVTTALGTNSAQNGAAVKVSLYKNALFIAAHEGTQGATVWGSAVVTAVLNCVPGDTISARGGITAAGPSSQTNSGETTHVSIVMVQAIPQ